MTDERFDSLEKADLAMEEMYKGYILDSQMKKTEYTEHNEGSPGQNCFSGKERRSGKDRRTGQGGWNGPERRSGKDRRLSDSLTKGKPVPRKNKALVALLLAFAILASTLYLMPLLIWQPVEEVVWVNQENAASDYDVIVVGAEPEGIAAAVSAARNGMNTLLLEKSSALGGLMTLGQLNFLDMCHGRDGTLLTQGIFEEFYDGVGGTAFDITEAKNYFIELVTAEPLLTLRTNAVLLSPVMEDKTLTGVKVWEKGSEVTYTAKRIIDATADGDLAALARAPYTYGGEDIGERNRQMGVTLVFELSDVSWPRVFLHLNGQRLQGMISRGATGMGATSKSAWGYENEGFSYVPRDPLMRLRGFNVARQRNNNVLINALLIFGVDPLNHRSYMDAIDRAKTELIHLLPYIRQNFTGFEKAELTATASQLYVRETRHFIGEYQLTIDDVLENRDQWDKIAVGSYPADVQPSPDQPFGTVIGNPDRYAVPFRSLVPLEAENLLIVGRSASYTSLAASSARVLPLGMACGQAAGAAAAQSINEAAGFREMSRDRQAIGRLQATLREQGAYLADFAIAEPVMSHWAYEGLAALRRLGLADGGYQNDYRLEAVMDKWRYQYLLNGVIRKAGYDFGYIEVSDMPVCSEVIDTVAAAFAAGEAAAAEAAGAAAGAAPAGIALSGDFRQNTALLADAGLLTPELLPYFAEAAKIPQAAEVIMLLANLYEGLLLQ